jgi:U3 small nucleolar RNA-associated protein 14
VDKLLKMAKLREEDIVKTEELKMNHLSVEEVAARRAELCKMRELLFRSEVKAKRLAKIKSKAYRRLRIKEKGKLAEKIDAEPDDDDEEARMTRETERAKERATLRHKHTGKWAKAMMGKHDLDVDQRREISAMLERGERLRAKIRGERSSGDEAGEGEDNDDSDGDGDGVAAIKVPVEPSPEPATPPESVSAAKESNPWLTNGNARKAPRRRNEILVDKNSASIEKSKNRLRKQARKREEEKEKAMDDAVVEISMSNVMALSSSTEAPPPSTVPRDNVREPSKLTGDDDDPDHNSEVEEQEQVLSRRKSKGLKAFQQRDLVALAFAGDNVVQVSQTDDR